MSRRYAIFFFGLFLVSLIFLVWTTGGPKKWIPLGGKKDYIWSIGIYTGDSPFNLIDPANINNPVLTADDVTDVSAEFVADPFMVYENNQWYMFFEVLNKKTNQGDIGLAVSDNGNEWNYKQIVLDEPFHLSYPYTFKWNNEYYMIPESSAEYDIRLYKAVDFPVRWTFVKTLMKGSYTDHAVFYYKDNWWLFAETNPKGHNTLSLYYADDLFGPWVKHAIDPVIPKSSDNSRPGGRTIFFNGSYYRFAQDASPYYGNQVRCFKITDISKTSYQEEEIEMLSILKGSGSGWNKKGMHHIDPHLLQDGKWIACVDGFTDRMFFGFNIKK